MNHNKDSKNKNKAGKRQSPIGNRIQNQNNRNEDFLQEEFAEEMVEQQSETSQEKANLIGRNERTGNINSYERNEKNRQKR
ncbi:hypothetical protein KHQ82_06080 [Mycoplasmatota bacterium]|nr:hypothetical protein KHQ82_06080 [Mycoplasmatota bacterium]